jgi:hypothetical protein
VEFKPVDETYDPAFIDRLDALVADVERVL